MQFQLLLQSIIVPLLISGLAYRILHRPYTILGITAGWLVSYFWVQGKLPLPPEQGEDSLWIFTGFAIVLVWFFSRKIQQGSLLLAFAICLLFISWPVLEYEINISFILEMLAFLIAAGVVVYAKYQNNRPAFMCAGGFTLLALITALSGSLLIGQLSASVAAAIGFFAIMEIRSGLRSQQMQDKFFRVYMLLYLLILYLARIFAEVDLYVVAILLAAGLSGLFARRNSALIISLVLYAAAVALMLYQDAGSSYY